MPRPPALVTAPALLASVVALLLTLASLVWSVDDLSRITPLPDRTASADYLADVRNQALAAFVTVRALSGLMDVVESATPSAGVVSVQPGRIIEPIDDLLGDLSLVLLAAAAIMGGLVLAQATAAALGLDAGVTFALLIMAMVPWIPWPVVRAWARRVGLGTLTMVLFVLLLVPAVAGVGQQVRTALLAPEYAQALQTVDTVHDRAAAHAALPPAAKDLPHSPPAASADRNGGLLPPPATEATETPADAQTAAEPANRAGDGLFSWLRHQAAPAARDFYTNTVGTATSGIQWFTDFITNPERREAFANSLVDLVKLFLFEVLVLPLTTGLLLYIVLKLVLFFPRVPAPRRRRPGETEAEPAATPPLL